MELQARQHKVNLSQIIPLVLIGVGLIVIGLVATKVLTSGGFSNDYSVVPSVVNFPAPEITLNDINGMKVRISDYHSK